MAPILNFLLPLAVEVFKLYIKSSSSKKDDLILSTVQDGCYYLSAKDNNTMNFYIADHVGTHSMVKDK